MMIVVIKGILLMMTGDDDDDDNDGDEEDHKTNQNRYHTCVDSLRFHSINVPIFALKEALHIPSISFVVAFFHSLS
jgi:hypothetical protein